MLKEESSGQLQRRQRPTIEQHDTLIIFIKAVPRWGIFLCDSQCVRVLWKESLLGRMVPQTVGEDVCNCSVCTDG